MYSEKENIGQNSQQFTKKYTEKNINRKDISKSVKWKAQKTPTRR